MRNLLLLLLLSTAARPADAQELRKFFLNRKLEIVSDSLAPYVGLAIQEGDSWQVALYDAARNVKIRHSYFDSTLSKAIGPATFYHSNGALMMQGHYRDGEMAGLWRRWDSSGRLTDSAFYDRYRSFVYRFQYDKDGILRSSRFEHAGGRKEVRQYASGQLVYQATQFGRSLTARHYWPSGQLAAELGRDFEGKQQYERFYDSSGALLSKRDPSMAYVKKLRKQYPYPADPYKYQYDERLYAANRNPSKEEPLLMRTTIHHNHDQVKTAPNAKSNHQSYQRTSEEARNEQMRRFDVPFLNLVNY